MEMTINCVICGVLGLSQSTPQLVISSQRITSHTVAVLDIRRAGVEIEIDLAGVGDREVPASDHLTRIREAPKTGQSHTTFAACDCP